MAKRIKSTAEIEEKPSVESEDTPSGASEGGGAAIMRLRNILEFVEKNTGVASTSMNFYEYTDDGCHQKVPVRAETVAPQPIPDKRVLHFGLEMSFDGTITTPIDPITGIAYSASSYKGFTYDPTSVWQTGDWYKSHGGRIYFALINNIRANNTFTEAELVKIVKALIGYDDIFRSLMLFYTYYNVKSDGWLNYILDTILSSSGGSSMFNTRDDLRGQIIAAFQEQFMPVPMMKFWVKRRYNAFSTQYPWYKYTLLLPSSTYQYYQGIARLFDAYVTTNNWMHPETYLRNEGLWNRFCTDLVPLLFDQKTWKSYIGFNPEEVLASFGWLPLSYDHVQIEYLFNKFFCHPFDEYLGLGPHELPFDVKSGARCTGSLYYWDAAGNGQEFYLGPDAYMGTLAVYSPWLDFVNFVGVIENYGANDDACNSNAGQVLRGGISWAGVVEPLEYDEFFTLFKRLAFRFQGDFELQQPDPDIAIYDEITAADAKFDLMMLYKDHFKYPFRMPDKHWYYETKHMHRMYVRFLGLTWNDIEIYKLQRPRDWESTNQLEGDKDRL